MKDYIQFRQVYEQINEVNQMDSTKLAKLSFEELRQMQHEVQESGKNDPGSFYIYTAKTRKKLDDIAWAISYKLQQKKYTNVGESK